MQSPWSTPAGGGRREEGNPAEPERSLPVGSQSGGACWSAEDRARSVPGRVWVPTPGARPLHTCGAPTRASFLGAVLGSHVGLMEMFALKVPTGGTFTQGAAVTQGALSTAEPWHSPPELPVTGHAGRRKAREGPSERPKLPHAPRKPGLRMPGWVRVRVRRRGAQHGRCAGSRSPHPASTVP